MTPEQFAYWLQGFVELTQGQTPNPAQWKSICEHLEKVFTKVTPPVGGTNVKIEVDTKDAQKAIEDLTEVMRRYRESMPLGQPWPFGGYPPGTTIC
ncbi:hypothetical protein WT25_11040 [Burkholderia territorii]|uniref:hypothetical protein n=1 Tax=Burkholderia territorii TaxID=1503055 RepID=UPI00075A36A7|nr:hypothetical protein [Burkholderia territorii]KVT86281.1 hypothetical protein WT25_11040 [Burkholderia territorii]